MTVLVGVDGSAGSHAAVRLAAQEARYRSAPLVAVMAYSADRALGAPAARPLATLRTSEDERAATEAALRDLVHDALGADAGNVTCRAVTGLPGRALVEAARTVNAQLVVLTTRSDTSMARVLGPVSQHVLRHAACPVLIVPDGCRAG
ncbi:MAG TPA: universal stress protein [Streptosporangiaceae bacterium]|nr:universal stress protein [Streptosporangiaceae bacterium]